MKIIFLDVDGVLNSKLWFEKLYQSKKIEKGVKKKLIDRIDPNAIQLLNILISNTGAKVVISSSVRKFHTTEKIQYNLNLKGFIGEIIGATPILKFTGLKNYNYSVPRGNEIKAWLEINKGILGDKISKTKYVILDDDNDMLLWQRENYIWVDPFCGLTPNIIERAIRILSK